MTSKEKLELLYKNVKENFQNRTWFLKRKDLMIPELEKECYQDLLKDLDKLEKLEKVFSDLRSMFEIKIGIDLGDEYFIEIKQLDTRIAELIIPQEDKEIFKEVFEYDK